MSRLLVTGATTELGRRLVRTLLATPGVEHILAVGIEPAGAHFHEANGELLSYEVADLTRSRSIRRLLLGPVREQRIDTVVHAAHHRSARDGGRAIHRLNVDSTRELLHLAERHPTLRRFVFRSAGAVYQRGPELPVLLQEDHPLCLTSRSPQWVRDRVEADLTVCTRMGMSPLQITVLRCAESPAADIGSQMFDYVRSAVCLRPLGHDPMLNLISLDDLVAALVLASTRPVEGIFNIPGADTLPLSKLIRLAGRRPVPLPGALIGPAYALRSAALGTDFRYDLNRSRFRLSGILDGRRATDELGYTPRHRLVWSHVARTARA